MYVKEAVEFADMLTPNNIPFEAKLQWIRAFEDMIWNTLILTHEGAPAERKPIKDEYSSLFIESPYNEVYALYLRMRMDEVNNDSVRYGNSKTLYNNALSEYRAYYNRTHMPIERATVKFF